MKARNEEIGTGEEGDAALKSRRRTDAGARGTRASKSRNAAGRTGPRNTGRRTSGTEAGSRKGLAATVNRLKERAGGRTAKTTRRSTTKGR
jgi:hypothetical protein